MPPLNFSPPSDVAAAVTEPDTLARLEELRAVATSSRPSTSQVLGTLAVHDVGAPARRASTSGVSTPNASGLGSLREALVPRSHRVRSRHGRRSDTRAPRTKAPHRRSLQPRLVLLGSGLTMLAGQACPRTGAVNDWRSGGGSAGKKQTSRSLPQRGDRSSSRGNERRDRSLQFLLRSVLPRMRQPCRPGVVVAGGRSARHLGHERARTDQASRPARRDRWT
jgi:hypothetical protein